METNKGTSDNGRIEFLKQKEREIRAKLAAEQVRQQRRKEKENARLASVVGAALIEACAKQPDSVGVMIRQLLQASNIRETDRAFLSAKGWA